jgi:hypothetical protein
MSKSIKQPNVVDHPPHYTAGPIEVIDIIEGFNLGFHLGNVVKYVLRSPHKGAEIEDLEKARWYLDRYIEKRGQPHG